MEKLITLFLTLLVTPLLAYDNQEVKLDLTLPETPFDYEQMDRDSKLIKDWEDRNRLRLFDNLPRPHQEQINYSWKINALDMITTMYALDTHDNVKEGNPILGEQPEMIEVFALKSSLPNTIKFLTKILLPLNTINNILHLFFVLLR